MEYDFALIVGSVAELTPAVEDALFQAGCDDATVSMQYGRLYIEFSRSATSLEDAIIGAIHDVRKAGIGAEVLRVDECNLVTASEIARRMGRSRQLVHQYMKGQRGPGGFPPPESQLTDQAPLWAWCAVSYWLVQNNLLRPQESWNAEVVEAINNWLESERQRQRYPELMNTITRACKPVSLQVKARTHGVSIATRDERGSRDERWGLGPSGQTWDSTRPISLLSLVRNQPIFQLQQ